MHPLACAIATAPAIANVPCEKPHDLVLAAPISRAIPAANSSDRGFERPPRNPAILDMSVRHPVGRHTIRHQECPIVRIPDYKFPMASAAPIHDHFGLEAIGCDEVLHFADVIVIDVNLEIDAGVQEIIPHIVIFRACLERLAQDNALPSDFEEALKWALVVVEIAEDVEADHMVDLAVQVFDPRLDQPLGRQAEAWHDVAADIDQRAASIKPPILDRQVPAGERMIEITAAAADIENAVANADPPRKHLGGLGV